MANPPTSDPWQDDQGLHRRQAREPRPWQHAPRRAATRRTRPWGLLLMLAVALGLAAWAHWR